MANVSIREMVDVWASGGTIFNAIKMDVTDTASASSSNLINLQVGSTTRFKVDKSGNVTASGTVTAADFVASGNVDLGDADTDTVTFNAEVDSNIVPDADSTYSLGSASKAWSNVYADSLSIGIGSGDGTVHVHSGSAGSVAAGAGNDDLVVENNGDAGVAVLTPDASTGRLVFGTPSDSFGAVMQWQHDSNLLTLGTDKSGADVRIISGSFSEAMRIDSSGNVGIGTTSPDGNLHIEAAEPLLVIDESDGTSTHAQNVISRNADIFKFQTRSSAGSFVANDYLSTIGSTGASDHRWSTVGSERMRIDSSGNVRFNAYGAGTLQTDASGNITASSDERLKADIASFDAGLDEIKQIAPISHKWSKASGFDQLNTYYGFSAQNVQAAIPEAVGVGSDGFLTLSDRPIIAALVNAVKTLEARVAELEAA